MTQTSPSFFGGIRSFAHQHDDLPAFHAAFLVLTFMAAALLNLGFFAILILMHMGLDVFKYREVHKFGWSKTIEGVVRESIVDIALFAMGLAIAVYLHPSLALYSGLKGLVLAELTVLRALGVLTPKLKILFDFIKIASHVDHYIHSLHRNLGKQPSIIEYVSIFSIFITAGMLLIAPVLLMIDAAEFVRVLMGELVPWNL